MGQRQVEVEALARPVAALVLIACVERVVVRWVGMNRDRQHVVAAIEDLLGAIAVMGIDVEDRDLAELRAQALGRDGGVVEIAEAAGTVGAGVVAGGTAERVDGALAGDDGVGCRHGRLGRQQRRAPAMLADRHRHVAEIPAELADEAGRAAGRADSLFGAAAPIGEGVGPDLRAALGRQVLPARPGRLEKPDEAGIMDLQHRARAVRGRPLGRDAVPGQSPKQACGALRQVLRRDHPAVAHVLLRIVNRLVGMIEGAHGSTGLRRRAGCSPHDARLAKPAPRRQAGTTPPCPASMAGRRSFRASSPGTSSAAMAGA